MANIENLIVLYEESEELSEIKILGVIEEKYIEKIIDMIANSIKEQNITVINSLYVPHNNEIIFKLDNGKQFDYVLKAVSKKINELSNE